VKVLRRHPSTKHGDRPDEAIFLAGEDSLKRTADLITTPDKGNRHVGHDHQPNL
jgi:hypothetical protein